MRLLTMTALGALIGLGLLASPAMIAQAEAREASLTQPHRALPQQARSRQASLRSARSRRVRPQPAPALSLRQARQGHAQRGRASFYAEHFHGRRMADGQRFDSNSNAAASRSLPLGSQARVTNLQNGRSAVVTIQDRGPFGRGRVIDVSPSTATLLGMRRAGVAMVEVVPVFSPAKPG